MKLAKWLGPRLLIPNWYRDPTVKKLECEDCNADAHYNPEWPWCGVCKHNVRKYGVGDVGKRFGTYYCDIVAGCHKQVDVLKITWDHEGVNLSNPLEDQELCKRIGSLTFFADFGDSDVVRSVSVGAPTVND